VAGQIDWPGEEEEGGEEEEEEDMVKEGKNERHTVGSRGRKSVLIYAEVVGRETKDKLFLLYKILPEKG